MDGSCHAALAVELVVVFTLTEIAFNSTWLISTILTSGSRYYITFMVMPLNGWHLWLAGAGKELHGKDIQFGNIFSMGNRLNRFQGGSCNIPKNQTHIMITTSSLMYIPWCNSQFDPLWVELFQHFRHIRVASNWSLMKIMYGSISLINSQQTILKVVKQSAIDKTPVESLILIKWKLNMRPCFQEDKMNN